MNNEENKTKNGKQTMAIILVIGILTIILVLSITYSLGLRKELAKTTKETNAMLSNETTKEETTNEVVEENLAESEKTEETKYTYNNIAGVYTFIKDSETGDEGTYVQLEMCKNGTYIATGNDYIEKNNTLTWTAGNYIIDGNEITFTPQINTSDSAEEFTVSNVKEQKLEINKDGSIGKYKKTKDKLQQTDALKSAIETLTKKN